MIRIRSAKHNFYRCGIAHPKDWREYPDSKFTKEEIKRLQQEPMLTVEIVDDKKQTKSAKAD
jgi:RNase H-fold protein (predicted Holliday junction resolvase)